MTPKTEWQPIDSAPLDGRRLLLWDGLRRHCGYWTYRGWFTDPAEYLIRPTHWMPLPEPPEVNNGID